MTIAVRNSGKARSIPRGLLFAASVSMIITFVLSAAITHALNTEKISWNQAGYWIMVGLFAASFIGGRCAIKAIKRKRIAVAVMSGFLYWGLLLCITALFFGGNYDAVWETAAVIAGGSGTSFLFSDSIYKNSRQKKRKAYR